MYLPSPVSTVHDINLESASIVAKGHIEKAPARKSCSQECASCCAPFTEPIFADMYGVPEASMNVLSTSWHTEEGCRERVSKRKIYQDDIIEEGSVH